MASQIFGRTYGLVLTTIEDACMDDEPPISPFLLSSPCMCSFEFGGRCVRVYVF